MRSLDKNKNLLKLKDIKWYFSDFYAKYYVIFYSFYFMFFCQNFFPSRVVIDRYSLLHCYKRRVNTSQNQGDFPGSLVGNNSPANTGDMGSIPGPGNFHVPQSN